MTKESLNFQIIKLQNKEINTDI